MQGRLVLTSKFVFKLVFLVKLLSKSQSQAITDIINNKLLMRNQDNSFTLKKKSLSKNKLTCKNAVAQINGSCTLQVMPYGLLLMFYRVSSNLHSNNYQAC